MTDTRRPCPLSNVYPETLDGEIVMLSPTGSDILHLNESSALIWRLCDGQRSVDDITGLLQAAYPDAAGEIAAQVPETLQVFADHQVMVWA
jgi:hypothetical protein